MAHGVADTRRILWRKESRTICKPQERRGEAGEKHPHSGQSCPGLSVTLGLSLSDGKIEGESIMCWVRRDLVGSLGLQAVSGIAGGGGGVDEWRGSCGKKAENKNHQLWK